MSRCAQHSARRCSPIHARRRPRMIRTPEGRWHAAGYWRWISVNERHLPSYPSFEVKNSNVQLWIKEISRLGTRKRLDRAWTIVTKPHSIVLDSSPFGDRKMSFPCATIRNRFWTVVQLKRRVVPNARLHKTSVKVLLVVEPSGSRRKISTLPMPSTASRLPPATVIVPDRGCKEQKSSMQPRYPWA